MSSNRRSWEGIVSAFRETLVATVPPGTEPNCMGLQPKLQGPTIWERSVQRHRRLRFVSHVALGRQPGKQLL